MKYKNKCVADLACQAMLRESEYPLFESGMIVKSSLSQEKELVEDRSNLLGRKYYPAHGIELMEVIYT